MKMKKLYSTMLAVCILGTMSACTGNGGGTASPSNAQAGGMEEEKLSVSPENARGEDGPFDLGL